MVLKYIIIGLLSALIVFFASLIAQRVKIEKKAQVPDKAPLGMSALECHARNLAFETLLNSHKKPEGRRELEAIMRVVFKRKELGRKAGYRNTDCGVIYQRAQFSWTLKRHLRYKIPDDKVRWEYMLAVARDGLAGKFEYPWPASHECITNYKRADNIGVGKRPAIFFRSRLRPVVQIEKHMFYCHKIKKKKLA